MTRVVIRQRARVPGRPWARVRARARFKVAGAALMVLDVVTVPSW